MNEKILGKEKVSKLFLKYTIPAVISMVLAGSQTMIDGMFLGNFVGSNAIASVNIVSPFIQIAMGVSIVVGLGSLSIIGRKLGEGNVKESQNTFRTAMVIILLFSLLYGLLGITKAEFLGGILGADGVLIEGVTVYLRTISFFLIFHPLMIFLGFTDRIIGKPQLYLIATITTLTINVGLDYLLIKVFELGIFGAAFATGISYLGGFIVVLGPMLVKSNSLNIYKGRFEKSCIQPMLYNGMSEGIGSASGVIATYLFNLEFMSRSGADGVAAFTSIGYIVSFGILLLFGIADGISPILSYNYGNRMLLRVKETMKMAIISGLSIGVILFCVMFFKGEFLVSMFAKGNSEIISMGTTGARIYAFAFLVNSINLIYSIYYTALGHAKESAIIALSRGLVCIIIGIKLWPLIFGIKGVWLTIPAAEYITVLVVAVLIKVRSNK